MHACSLRARGALFALLTALALLVSGCATTPPLPRPPAGSAQPPRDDGLLAEAERRIAAQHGACSTAVPMACATGWRCSMAPAIRSTSSTTSGSATPPASC
jgi:hypothetical protein